MLEISRHDGPLQGLKAAKGWKICEK